MRYPFFTIRPLLPCPAALFRDAVAFFIAVVSTPAGAGWVHSREKRVKIKRGALRGILNNFR